MIDTQLIMLEGLPSTGKSTNSDFLRIQLERNGKKAKWIHEVTRPHPMLLFSQACLNRHEYEDFLKAYPESAQILNSMAVFTKNAVVIDLLEIEWNYMDIIDNSAFQSIKAFDSWNFTLDKYEEFTLGKWEHFSKTAVHDKDTVYILDSSIFQAQIFVFLWNNAPYERLKGFVNKLCNIVKSFNPSLIYLYRENTEATIDYLEKNRGKQGLEHIWERDKTRSYYQDKPKGAEGFKQFLRDYANFARQLFDCIDFRKISIEISKFDWAGYESEMLSFLDIEKIASPEYFPPNGVYKNKDLNYEISVEGLSIIDPNGNYRKLTPKNAKEFYVQSLPMILHFEDSGQIVMSGIQISERWTTAGTIYKKVVK